MPLDQQQVNWRDKEVVISEVSQYGRALRYVTNELKGDKEVVMAAVKQNGRALQYATEEMKGDKDVVLEAVRQNAMALYCATEEARDDRDVVMAAISQDGMALGYASTERRDDREIVMLAATISGCAFGYAGKKLRGDKGVVLKAVANDARALEYAAVELKGDKEVVMIAVAQDGHSLYYASMELRGDKEVVLIAVAQNGRALQHATKKLRGDKEVVMAAVKNDCKALQHATPIIRSDKDVLVAMAPEKELEPPHTPLEPESEIQTLTLEEQYEVLDSMHKKAQEKEVHRMIKNKSRAEALSMSLMESCGKLQVELTEENKVAIMSLAQNYPEEAMDMIEAAHKTAKKEANLRGWEAVFDEASGDTYYWNSLTDETTWLRPLGFKDSDSGLLTDKTIDDAEAQVVLQRKVRYQVGVGWVHIDTGLPARPDEWYEEVRVEAKLDAVEVDSEYDIFEADPTYLDASQGVKVGKANVEENQIEDDEDKQETNRTVTLDATNSDLKDQAQLAEYELLN